MARLPRELVQLIILEVRRKAIKRIQDEARSRRHPLPRRSIAGFTATDHTDRYARYVYTTSSRATLTDDIRSWSKCVSPGQYALQVRVVTTSGRVRSVLSGPVTLGTDSVDWLRKRVGPRTQRIELHVWCSPR